MRSLRVFLDPSGRLLARSLDHLHRTLEALREKLRLAVASSVGQTVGGIVEAVVQALSNDPPPVPPLAGHWMPTTGGSRLPIQEDDPWFYGADERLFSDPTFAPSALADPMRDQGARATGPARAIALGLQTTLAWLRHGVGRRPVWSALGVGLLTGLAVYAGGPLAAAAVGLAGSALGVISLSETVRAVADSLTLLRAG